MVEKITLRLTSHNFLTELNPRQLGTWSEQCVTFSLGVHDSKSEVVRSQNHTILSIEREVS